MNCRVSGSAHQARSEERIGVLLSGFLGASNVTVRSVSGEETGGAARLTNPASHKACRSCSQQHISILANFLEAALLNFSPRLIKGLSRHAYPLLKATPAKNARELWAACPRGSDGGRPSRNLMIGNALSGVTGLFVQMLPLIFP
jgi:hypothetical protein